MNGDDYYIPMAFDPNPAPGPSPLIKHPMYDRQQEEEAKQSSRDYFNTKVPNTARKASHDIENARPTSRPDSMGNSQPSSPHIAYQEKGREPSSDILDTIRKRNVSGTVNGSASAAAFSDPSREASPQNGVKDGEKFRLQDVPKRRKSGSSARNSKSDIASPSIDTSGIGLTSKSAPASANAQLREQHVLITSNGSPKLGESDSTNTTPPRASQDSRAAENGATSLPKSHSSPLTTQLQNLPQRGDSLQQLTPKPSAISRKEVGGFKPGYGALSADSSLVHTPGPATSVISQDSPTFSAASVNGGRIISRPLESPISKSSVDFMQPPARAKDRPMLSGGTTSDSFVSPRAPPHPPMEIHHNHKGKSESISTLQSESTRNGDIPSSPALPRYSAGGEFTMAEDMARILGNDEPDQDQASFLRRVSNSVRHARSYSDRGTRLSREQKWPKSPLNGTIGDKFGRDVTTPTNTSPEPKPEYVHLMTEIRKLRQSSEEKDRTIAELEKVVESKASINQMNTELRKKRSTIVVLDTQKDMVIRELEVMTDQIAKTKQSAEPLDVGKLTNVMLVDFADALQKLKDSFAPDIEEFVEQKITLSEEVSRIKADRDKALQELTHLSAKNDQLSELNNQLVYQIQERYKQSKGPISEISAPAPQGLGIYTQHSKDKSNASMDSHEARPSVAESYASGTTLHSDHDIEPATYLSAPQVVNIRKGQPKKFNWRKGGQNVAKGVTKGLKGAFTATYNEPIRSHREGSITEGIPYGSMPQSQDYPSTSLSIRNTGEDLSKQGHGFFGNAKPKSGQARNLQNGNGAVIIAENATGMKPQHVSKSNTNRT